MSNFNDLMHLAVRGFNDIEQLLDAFFGFLCTQTDFYHTQLSEQELRKFGLNSSVNLKGFKRDHMRRVLMHIHEKNLRKYREKHQPYLLSIPESPASGNASNEVGTGFSMPPMASGEGKARVERTSAGEIEAAASNRQKASNAAGCTNVAEVISNDYTIVPWNGGKTSKYCWNQTFTDVTIEVVSKEPLTSKNVKVIITTETLELHIKGLEILKGRFPHPVKASEAMWNIEDKRRVMISLEKPREIWWDCLLEGEEKIDVTKIDSVKRFDEFTATEQHEMLKLMKKHREKQSDV